VSRVIACLAALFAVATASTAHASIANGRIINLYVMPQGVMLFDIDGTRTTPPGCASPSPTRWALDLKTPGGQAQGAAILWAISMNRSIGIEGTDACDVWGSIEAVGFFGIANQ